MMWTFWKNYMNKLVHYMNIFWQKEFWNSWTFDKKPKHLLNFENKKLIMEKKIGKCKHFLEWEHMLKSHHIFWKCIYFYLDSVNTIYFSPKLHILIFFRISFVWSTWKMSPRTKNQMHMRSWKLIKNGVDYTISCWKHLTTSLKSVCPLTCDKKFVKWILY